MIEIMRRIYFFLCATSLLFISFCSYGQTSDYYLDWDLLVKKGEYCRTVRYEMHGLTAREIRQRTVDKAFWDEFGLEFWSTGFNGGMNRTGAQGHFYDFREGTTGMIFQDLKYGWGFNCMDGYLEITLCHIVPGYARRSSLGVWKFFWQDLAGGVDSIEYYGIDRPFVKKWQLALIRYMDGFFKEQAPKMRDYILFHPSEYESLQLKEN